MEAAMGDTKALQEKLFEEMKGRIKQDDLLCRSMTVLMPMARCS